jgi:hypothetical protein
MGGAEDRRRGILGTDDGMQESATVVVMLLEATLIAAHVLGV